MLQISNNNIYLTRGDTADIVLNIVDTDGNEYDYSNDQVVFTLKRNCATNNAILTKTVTDGLVSIAPSDTQNLPYGSYFFDIQVTQGDDVYTVIAPIDRRTPNFHLSAEVTFNYGEQ